MTHLEGGEAGGVFGDVRLQGFGAGAQDFAGYEFRGEREKAVVAEALAEDKGLENRRAARDPKGI